MRLRYFQYLFLIALKATHQRFQRTWSKSPNVDETVHMIEVLNLEKLG